MISVFVRMLAPLAHSSSGIASSLIDSQTLTRGLLAGAIAVFASGVLAVALQRDEPGVIGIPLAIAAIVTLRRQLGAAGVPASVIIAALLMALGCEWVARTPRKWPLVGLAFVPGTVVLCMANVAGLAVGTRVGCGVGAGVTAIALSQFDRRHARDGMLIPMFAVSCVAPILIARGNIAGPAIFASVVLFSVLLFPRPQARFGDAGVGAASVAYWWTFALIANGSGPRVAAGWVALGFLLLEPLERVALPAALRPGTRGDRDSRWLVLVTAAISQGVCVTYAIVVTAHQLELDAAMLSMLPILLIGGWVATAVAPKPRKRRKSRDTDRDLDLREDHR